MKKESYSVIVKLTVIMLLYKILQICPHIIKKNI